MNKTFSIVFSTRKVDQYYIDLLKTTSKAQFEKEKLTAQQIGTAVTYGRRYGLSAIVGIAQYDDDANSIRK